MVIWKAVAAGGSTDRGSLRGGDADEVTAAEGQEPVPLVYNPPFFYLPRSIFFHKQSTFSAHALAHRKQIHNGACFPLHL